MLYNDPWPSELFTAIGVLLTLGGISMVLFRRQEIRDRQRSYDPSRWWSYPSPWQENVTTILGGLLILALGIFVIVVSLMFEPPLD